MAENLTGSSTKWYDLPVTEAAAAIRDRSLSASTYAAAFLPRKDAAAVATIRYYDSDALRATSPKASPTIVA
jgi:hypothetical protein